MKHVILNGCYCMGSAGDDAPLEVITRMLRKKLNNQIKFTVMARHLDKDFEDEYGVTLVKNFEYDFKNQGAGKFLKGFNPDDNIDDVSRIIDIFKTGDLLILGAGNFINENSYGLFRGMLARLYVNLWIAQWCKLPVMLFGLSSDPLQSEIPKLTAEWLFANADVVSFREHMAPQNMINSGVKLPDYRVLPDPVLGMKQIAASKRPQSNSTNKTLGVSVRNMIHKGESENSQYLEFIKRFITQWININDNNQVIFIPQFVYHEAIDDIDIAKQILALLPDSAKSNITIIQGKYWPWETEQLYHKCDVALTTRLHATVFALRTGIPIRSISYESKVKGLFHSLNCPKNWDISYKMNPEKIASDLFGENKDSRDIIDIQHQISQAQKSIEDYANLALRVMK